MTRICTELKMDVSQLGKSVKYEHSLMAFDDNNQPQELIVTVSAPDGEDFSRLFNHWGADILSGQTVTGKLEGDREFSTVLKAAKGVKHDGPQPKLALTFFIDDTRIQDTAKGETGPWTCTFTLTNVKLWIGDEKTILPLPPGADPEKYIPGWTLNKIRFLAAGREWILTDELYEKWRSKDKPDESRTLLTATLRTTVKDKTEIPIVQGHANELTDLLSLALGREVSWYSCTVTDARGKFVSENARSILGRPFNRGGSAAVDNYEFASLKRFLETAYPIYAQNSAWWRTTLALFLEVQTNPILDIKSVLLSTLSDRISSAVLKGKKLGAQIDENLDKIADDQAFQAELNTVLMKLSPKWTKQRTEAFVRTIKGWNSAPSFPNKVILACKELKLNPPNPDLLKPRHKLLHTGELEVEGDVLSFWKDFECLILLMILVMVGYSGLFYHYKLGPNAKPLKGFLTA